jgi:hypothetical protein
MDRLDVFVSYAPPDLPEARKLANRLVAAGLRVFLLEWVAPGVVEYEAREAALLGAANGVLLFSRATMKDPAIRDDYAVLLKRVHSGARLFVPVRIDDVELPPFAGIRRAVRLYGIDDAEYDDQVAALVEALRPAERLRDNPARTEIRMGFGVDVVGYSTRPTPLKDEVQRRLTELLPEVLGDLGLGPAQVDQQDTGDGMNVFLPATVEVHRALPGLLHSWRDRLARDNGRCRDRLRLRLAAVVGPVGWAPLGFTGATVVELSRLLDSDVLRGAVVAHPGADLVVLVSHQLHAYVVGEGHPGLDANRFRRHVVNVRTYSGDAWLWIG